MARIQHPGDGTAGRHTISGVITLVQEDRFTLFCDDGVHRLFLLAPGCPADLPGIETAMRRKMHVAVACDQPPDLIAARAHHIYQTDSGSGDAA